MKRKNTMSFKAFHDNFNKMENIFLARSVAESPVENKKHDTKKDFYKAFNTAWKQKLPITVCDDAQSRLCGFITESREGRFWHYISISKLPHDFFKKKTK